MTRIVCITIITISYTVLIGLKSEQTILITELIVFSSRVILALSPSALESVLLNRMTVFSEPITQAYFIKAV